MLAAMTAHRLAQLNVSRLRAPLDDPSMAEFVKLLPELNALADASPGFVWRLQADNQPDATSLRPFEPDVILNMSVWESLATFRAYAYRSPHLDALRRRREWFHPQADGRGHLVLWWIPTGHLPTVTEAGEKLDLLRRLGPTPAAFTLRQPFAAPAVADRRRSP